MPLRLSIPLPGPFRFSTNLTGGHHRRRRILWGGYSPLFWLLIGWWWMPAWLITKWLAIGTWWLARLTWRGLRALALLATTRSRTGDPS